MLRNHKKLKKYQYLYLETKIFCKWSEADYDCEIHRTNQFNIDDRSQHLLNWLKKINKRYNYA